MTEGNFVDYVKIYVSSGKGGKGSTHLHREKFIEKGGPDGGDGGAGIGGGAGGEHNEGEEERKVLGDQGI